MSRSEYEKVKTHLLKLLAQDSDVRKAQLASLAQSDPLLHGELQSLLSHHQEAASILDSEILPAGQTLVDTSLLDACSQIPDQLRPYIIEKVIGEGGMGVVYQALQTSPLRRHVAIKHVRLGMDTARILERFQGESQALARMNHPNIATVHDAGVDPNGRPYFVMEFVDGQSMIHWCRNHKPTLSQKLDVFLILCEAVQHAHQKGIIHRDLKPGNLLIDTSEETPRLKIIDFGIAKVLDDSQDAGLTRPGLVLGTPSYMSPEQFGAFGGQADTRTDVYALGAVLFEMLTGESPVVSEGASLEQARLAVLENKPNRPPGVPTDLANVLLMALRKDPERRYASVDQMAADIQRFQKGAPVVAHADSWHYRTKKFVGRNKLAVGLLSLVFLLMAGATLMVSLQSQRIKQQRNRALAAEMNARNEAETAREVSDFLVGLIAAGSPDENPGKSLTVREVVDAGAQRINTELQDRPAIQWRLLSVLGEVYTGLGHLDRADSLLSQTLATQQKVFGPEHAEIAITLEQWGTVAHGQSRFSLAVLRYRRALDMLLRLEGKESVRSAYLMNSLAVALDAQGDYEEAKPLYEEALALNRMLLGDVDPEVAWGLNTLGQSRWRLGHYLEAQEMFGEAVQLSRRIFDGPHPDLMAALNNYGGSLHLNGELEASEKSLREALNGYQHIFPDGHFGVGRAHTNYALVLKELGRQEEALFHYEQGAAHMEEMGGNQHFHYAKSLLNLGFFRLALGQIDQGLLEMQTAHGIMVERVGQNHPYCAKSHLFYAEGLVQKGRPEAAVAAAEIGMAIHLERLDPLHPLVATARETLAISLAALGEQERARLEARQAIEILANSLGPGHYQTLKTKTRLQEAGLVSIP